jgi:hypothetical protein
VPILLIVGAILLVAKPLVRGRSGSSAATIESPASPAANPSKAGVCSHCGAKLQPEWLHCPQCGAPV